MAALSKARHLAHALSEAEQAMMAALSDMLETADAVTISRRRVAIIVDAAMFDRFNELVDIATTDGGREADSDDDDDQSDREPSLGSLNDTVQTIITERDTQGRGLGLVIVEGRQLGWACSGLDDREDDGGDLEPDESDGPGPAFRMNQAWQRWYWPP